MPSGIRRVYKIYPVNVIIWWQWSSVLFVNYYALKEIQVFVKQKKICKIYAINLAASLLANGIIRMLVGNATIKPITQPFKNLWINASFHPLFTIVIMKVIAVSKANVIKNATNNPEYFLFNFKSFNHSPSCFMK